MSDAEQDLILRVLGGRTHTQFIAQMEDFSVSSDVARSSAIQSAYRGQWVAVLHGALIAHSPDFHRFRALLEDSGMNGTNYASVYVERPCDAPYMGHAGDCLWPECGCWPRELPTALSVAWDDLVQRVQGGCPESVTVEAIAEARRILGIEP